MGFFVTGRAKRCFIATICFCLLLIIIVSYNWLYWYPTHNLVTCSAPRRTDERSVKQQCCSAFTGVSLQDFCDSVDTYVQAAATQRKAMDLNCSCVDVMYCRLVYATALSRSHYYEAQDMIASVQHHLPNTRLIVYDLGLTETQKNTLSSYCGVELRLFKFKKYPPHVRTIHYYSWKPLIAKELSEEFEVFLYGDSSIRVMASPVQYILPLLQEFPFVAGPVDPYLPIVALTMDKMIEYLQVNHTRKEMGLFAHMPGGCWAMWPNTLLRTKFLNPWVDCALHQECIAPPGSSLYHCNFVVERITHGTGRYIGCHRYDQSAMAMILIREFGLSVWNKTVHWEAKHAWLIERKPSIRYASICHCP